MEAGGWVAVRDVRLTVRPGVGRQALAFVALNSILTGSSVATGIVDAIVDVDFTVGPLKSCIGAVAGKAIETILTDPLVLARISEAVIDIHLALLARPAGLTRAFKTVDSVMTGTVVLARLGQALVDVSATEIIRIARSTQAFRARECGFTGGSVLTLLASEADVTVGSLRLTQPTNEKCVPRRGRTVAFERPLEVFTETVGLANGGICVDVTFIDVFFTVLSCVTREKDAFRSNDTGNVNDSLRTGASVVSWAVRAVAAILARFGIALVYLLLTLHSAVSDGTGAGVVVDFVSADLVGLTGVRPCYGTVINVDLTGQSIKPRGAGTLKTVHSRLAGAVSSILARLEVSARIVDLGTVDPHPILATHAVVRIHTIQTGSVVLARIWIAIVDVGLAREASIARGAGAVEFVESVFTTAYQTRVGDAFVDVYLTQPSCPPRHTFACVTVDPISAVGSIPAVVVFTLIDVGLTPLARVARVTITGVGIDPVFTR